MNASLSKRFSLSPLAQVILLGLAAAPLLAGFIWLHGKIGGWDWVTCLRPATIAFFSGRSPYHFPVCQYLSPPWALLILAPFAVLPEWLGGVLIGLCNIGVTALLAYRLGGKPASVVLIALSYPVIWGALLSQIDWIPMLGLLLPPQIGLFFVLVKPQLGISIALFWFISAWQQGGVREVVRVFWPATLAHLVSFAVFGLYPLRGFSQLSADWNVSPWPYAIPVGLFLLYLAVRSKKIQPAIFGSFMFSPYINKCSLAFPMLALAGYPVLAAAVSVLSWAMAFLHL